MHLYSSENYKKMLHFDTKIESELPLEGLFYDLLRLREKQKNNNKKI